MMIILALLDNFTINREIKVERGLRVTNVPDMNQTFSSLLDIFHLNCNSLHFSDLCVKSVMKKNYSDPTYLF